MTLGRLNHVGIATPSIERSVATYRSLLGAEAIGEPFDLPAQGVRVCFVDEGPGIPDLDLALQDGCTSGTGLGLGLSGSRRLVDSFTIESEVDRGTSVRIVKWGR